MYSLLFLGIASFLLSLLITPVVRNLFRGWGIVDRPDGARKHHEQPVPRVGGIAILLSSVAAFGLLFIAGFEGGQLVEKALPLAKGLLISAGLIFLVGLLDDIFGLSAWQKLAGQMIPIGVAYWAGVRVSFFGSEADWWSLPLTVVWLVLCTNAVNLIDGVDGLAAGVGLFAAATTLLAALLQNNFALAAATVPLVGALLGFLRYNFSPATIFLGDSGSLLVGFLLGCYGVLWSQESATILGMTAPLMALSIPLLDTALAIARRFLSRRSIFAADRGHIHHRLLDRGFTPRRVALVLYALCGVSAMFSLFMSSHEFEALVIVGFCAVVWLGIQQLGYVEFGVFGRMFMEGAFRHMLGAQIALRNHERKLDAAATPRECWTVIEAAAREFGFCGARMMLAGETFEFSSDIEAGEYWEMTVSLSDNGLIELTHAFSATSHGSMVAPFADMLRRTIASKLFKLPAISERPVYRAAQTAGR